MTDAIQTHRGNSFDLLRLAAALLVVVGHAYPLAGYASPAVAGNTIQLLGVKIFLVISGYLVMQSWQRDPSAVRFAWRRALRIFPGLICVTAMCALGLGLVVTDLTWREYLHNVRTWSYFSNLLFYPQYDLPAVFTSNVYPTAVNGSLWSLPVEVAMYVLGPVAWVVGARALRSANAGLIFACVVMASGAILARRVYEPMLPVIYGTAVSSFLDVAHYFLLGAVFNLPVLKRHLHAGIAVVAILFLAVMEPHRVASEVLLCLILPYGVLSIGQRNDSVSRWLARHDDISYGIYLYGFPVQQLVSHWMSPDRHTPWTNTALALPMIFCLALGSWRLVEQPCLTLKPAALGRNSNE